MAVAHLGGCSTRFDMATIPSPDQQATDVLVVFITGFTDTPEEVRKNGVLDTIYRWAGPVDAVVVYHEAGEYLNGSFVPQIERRITDEEWFRKYRKRVLIGYSSGGTAALRLALSLPTSFDAVILYSPYLGPQFIIDEIVDAGGVNQWSAPGPRERQEELWMWIKEYAKSPMNQPLVYFLWSREDEVAPGLDLLQKYLPADRILVGPGSHGWKSFNGMWPQFVREHGNVFRSS